MFYCCLNQLCVVLSFHFGLGPIKRIGMIELHQWVHFCLWHLLHPEADLQLGYTAGCVHSPVCSSAVPADIVKKTHSQTCTYIHTCHKCVGVILTYFFLSHTNIQGKDTAAHKDTFSHTLHLEKITIPRIYRS